MNFAQTGDLKEGFYNKLDEIDEAFNQRANDLEMEVVKKYSNERTFYEYLKVHDEIHNILDKYNVDEKVSAEIKTELRKQIEFFSNDILFFSNYYFKAGAIYGANIYQQFFKNINNKDN